MNLVEKFIDCAHCKGNACSLIEDKDSNYKVLMCFGCGFSSSPGCTEENRSVVEETLPELYKDLRFKDDNDLYWYPLSINIENLGLIFADGTSINDWKWAVIKSRKIKLKEKLKYPEGTRYIPNMKSLKHFEVKDFMEGLECLGYFSQIN